MYIFSPSIKLQMRDCILAIFWPRKDINGFFKEHHIPMQVLKTIESWDEKKLSRSKMVELVFQSLSNLPDNGTMYFNAMLDSLSQWNHFDEYWFVNQKKLDLKDAKSKVASLKVAKESNLDKAKERIKKTAEENNSRQERHNSMQEMRDDFDRVYMESKSSQERGYAFESFLTKMARFFQLKVTDPFRVKGTQIDGVIKFEGENYIIEAKWHNRQLSDEPLLAFCKKQEMNMHGRGIFISINGVTDGALSMLEKANIKNTILMDGEDITLILQELITFPELLDKKITAAQTRGKFYINPITSDSKIKR